MADGSFDPLHAGHLRYLHQARALGAPLLVNLCPDSYTITKHPILLPIEDRAQILDALAIVDYVHVAAVSTADVLRRLQPRSYVKGREWMGCLPQPVIDACGGCDIVYTDTPTQSSTALLRQLQPDVDRFEALVQSQQPAATPWTPTAAVPYDFQSRKIAEGEHPQRIVDTFGEAAEDFVDVGAGPGHLVKLLHDLGMHGAGLDVAYQVNAHVFGADVTDPDGIQWPPRRLVICREVLEHLTVRQIRQAVTNLCALSAQFVYLTTRFSQARHFLDFATSDDLDPTHISILPMPWLRHLFVLEGFKRRADLEQRMDWQKKGRVLVYER